MPIEPVDTPLRPGLYVVATPIGNLQDLSPRALLVLRTAAIVAAEDTRVSGKLVRMAGGAGRMVSLTEHNTNERSRSLLDAARESVVALVSDAGTPGVSDPGARLVEDAHEAGITVVAIPGPSALAAAISVAGFGAASVRFLGFLPRQRGERLRLLKEEGAPGSVLVLFESPNRLGDTLGELAELFANPEVGVCRELTKVHEEVVRGRAAELGPRFASTRGECTVVVRIPAAEPGANDGAELRAYMEEMQRAGARRSAAAVEAARRFGVTREAAYECWRET